MKKLTAEQIRQLLKNDFYSWFGEEWAKKTDEEIMTGKAITWEEWFSRKEKK